MRKSIQEVSRETLVLENFVRTIPPGEQVPFALIEEKTGVRMNQNGKGHLRTAVKRAGRVCAAIRGFGIKMSNEAIVVDIMGAGVKRVRNGMRKIEKNGSLMLEQHGPKMDVRERNTCELTVSAIAAMRVSAESRARELVAIEKARPPLAPPIKPGAP
jgi:hypothetical protein